MKTIREIGFLRDTSGMIYKCGDYGVEHIEPATKNGEMALVTYYKILDVDRKLIAEMHEFTYIKY